MLNWCTQNFTFLLLFQTFIASEMKTEKKRMKILHTGKLKSVDFSTSTAQKITCSFELLHIRNSHLHTSLRCSKAKTETVYFVFRFCFLFTFVQLQIDRRIFARVFLYLFTFSLVKLCLMREIYSHLSNSHIQNRIFQWKIACVRLWHTKLLKPMTAMD